MLAVTFEPLTLSVNGPIATDGATGPLLRRLSTTVPSSAHYAIHLVQFMNADISSTKPPDTVANMFVGVVCHAIF